VWLFNAEDLAVKNADQHHAHRIGLIQPYEQRQHAGKNNQGHGEQQKKHLKPVMHDRLA
jgi:hypothetical protein